MIHFRIIKLFTAAIAVLIISGCRYDKGTPTYNGFPTGVGKLFFTKCSTTGCHNDVSKDAAAGLSMSSWDKLFEGDRGGAAVIPFRNDFSIVFSFCNTFNDLGISNPPTMPFNMDKLTHDEVLLIKNWINAGAPNNLGFVKFSDNPNRKKFYVANQGCDVVTVFDQETLLPMRYINIGNSGLIEAPHDLVVSPDGQYWYVCFLAGNSLQKYRTSDDSFVGEANLGSGSWNTITINADGSKAYVIDYAGGNIAVVDLNTLTSTPNFGFHFPHGSCLSPAGDFLYVTEQTNSNKLYKIPVNDFSSYTEINLYTSQPPAFLNSHVVNFSPDGSRYFVTCQGTSEVRVFNPSNDSLLAIIPVGGFPQEMDFSEAHKYLFVTCEEDTLTFPGKRGSIAIIDINGNSSTNNTLIKIMYSGWQPHGISVDDNKNMVYVANRNRTSDGPAPHHTSVCGGKDGYVTFIDMNTLTLVKTGASDKQIEVSVDPYEVAVQH